MDEYAKMQRLLRNHKDAEIKNIEWLKYNLQHPHTVGMCKVINALLDMFSDKKIKIILEVEIIIGRVRANPEDIVVWVEDIGLFVLEIKSHKIDGIRSFENNVPQVIYQTGTKGDVDLLKQPRDFAYKLRGDLEPIFEDENIELPALYYAGWLPFVSQGDVASKGTEISQDQVWLSDMLKYEAFIKRLPKMKNLTGGKGAGRSTLDFCMKVFGCSSGVIDSRPRRTTSPNTIGQLIDERERQLKQLTSEQKRLAFSLNLVKGPKVIRGVVGSGKTIILANAVANVFLREYMRSLQVNLFTNEELKRVLILCYNVTLIDFIKSKILECFEQLKPNGEWQLPHERLLVTNIDSYERRMFSGSKKYNIKEETEKKVKYLFEIGIADKNKYDHVFIDEGQDIELEWFPLIREVAKPMSEGLSIVIFYDDAQNIYGRKSPGTSTIPAWKEFLGSEPHNRGLETVMKVGHRNTNQILSFSFHLLLGTFAEHDPQMATFANLNEYSKFKIPNDPTMNHPNAGKPCVELIGPRQYKVNFALAVGALPKVYHEIDRHTLLNHLTKNVKSDLNPKLANVDPRDILIMTHRRESLLEIMNALDSTGIKWHCPIKLSYSVDPRAKNFSSEHEFKIWDPRKEPFYQEGHITLCTVKSAKGYTAHICHVVFIEDFAIDDESCKIEREQQYRAELHVACTRATLDLSLWGTGGYLLKEAEDALEELREIGN